MACLALVILLSVFCVIPQPVEVPDLERSSSTINKSVTSLG